MEVLNCLKDNTDAKMDGIYCAPIPMGAVIPQWILHVNRISELEDYQASAGLRLSITGTTVSAGERPVIVGYFSRTRSADITISQTVSELLSSKMGRSKGISAGKCCRSLLSEENNFTLDCCVVKWFYFAHDSMIHMCLKIS